MLRKMEARRSLRERLLDRLVFIMQVVEMIGCYKRALSRKRKGGLFSRPRR